MMFKNVLTAAILTNIAFVVGAISDATNKQCFDRCDDICDPCGPPNTCSDDEIDCGLEQTTPTFRTLCSFERRTCVAKNCTCPEPSSKGGLCPVRCSIACGEEEIECKGHRNDEGCKDDDFCFAKGLDLHNNTCPGYCPIKCDEKHLNCTTKIDENGCKFAPDCIPKSLNYYGQECQIQACPAVCMKTELLCYGKIDRFGCKDEDFCVEKGISFSGELCFGNCPVKCDPDMEVTCEGQIVYTDITRAMDRYISEYGDDWNRDISAGCKGPNVCRTKVKDINGDFCPEKSDSHGCPITCPEDQVLCETRVDFLGCKEQAFCHNRTKDVSGNFCPESSDCPALCHPYEVSCPGDVDENGCKEPDVCVEQERSFAGELCTIQCPPSCNENEILCGGEINEAGCRHPYKCLPRGLKTKGIDIGGPCPGYCPPKCNEDEILCSSNVDCDGCNTPEVCVPAAKDLNGMFCYKDSASHMCMKECDDANGEVLCPAQWNFAGCKTNDICKQLGKGFDGQYCPDHSVCPIHCDIGHIACYGGTDDQGCKNPDICLPKGQDADGEYCTRFCPPKCHDNQRLCIGPELPNGCEGDPMCVERQVSNNGDLCPGICPVYCEEDWIAVSGGVDESGCELHPICVPCHPKCRDDDISCPVDPVTLCGIDECCKTQSACQNRTIDIFGEFCPDESECPVICNENCHVLTNVTATANNTVLPDQYVLEERQALFLQNRQSLFNNITDITTTNDTCDEFSCPQGLDENGCPKRDICIKKELDINGNMCPETCPATCEADQTICADGERDELGCREQESCHNQTRNIHGEFCPYESVCPALCNITEVLCDNGIDEEGCKHPSICYQPEKNYYGEFCNFTCPGICSDEEILCPGHPIDINGCKGQPACYNRTTGFNETEFCPDSSDCPIYCNVTEVLCPTGFDEMGCKTLDECIEQVLDINGTVCPFTCPGICTEEEVLCPGHPIDKNGCEGQPACYNRTTGFNSTEFCPDSSDCPIYCNETQFKCPTGLDEIGCKTPDECIEQVIDINGDICPFHCPGLCTEDQVLCDGHPIDEYGCSGQPSCYNRTRSNNGSFCPDSSDCPIYCNKTEAMCPTGFDDTGCKTPDVCIQKERDFNGELCPFHCPGVCTDDQILCPGHKMDLEGCEGQATCQNRTKDNDGNFCPDISDCPTFCLSNEVRCPGGFDENGCKIPDVCIPEERDMNDTMCPIQHCPINCNETESFCEGLPISWQNGTDGPWLETGCREEDICHPRGLNNLGDVCGEKCPAHCNSTEVECEGQIIYGNGTDAGCRTHDECRPRSVSEFTGEFCSEKSDSHGCPITCPEHQILCPAKRDMSGCLEPAFCYDRTKSHNDTYCSDASICPTICGPDEVDCFVGIGEDGCALPDECYELVRDINGEKCPFHCPGICNDYEYCCEGHKKDELGCIGQRYCVNITIGDNGTACPYESVCPTFCELDEYVCPLSNGENGCNAPEECFTPHIDIHGQPCPFHCPGICTDDEILCPGHPMDDYGCKGQPTCHNITTGHNGVKCPDDFVCPFYCQPDEQWCDQGIDENGCMRPGICVKQEIDINGNFCPFVCPAICNENEVLCGGYRDEVGCKKPEECIRRHNKTKGGDIGGLCPGFCPAECLDHEVLCPGHLDCDGCPTDESCWPAAKDSEGTYCEGDLSAISCPLWCDEEIGETLCPTYDSLWECKPTEICMNRTIDDNGNFCHAHSVCPRECAEDEIICDDGIDSLGCKNVDLCVEKGTDVDGNYCPRQCPPKCNETEFLCRGATKLDGCQDHDVCVEKELDIYGITCPRICPIICNETQVMMDGGRDERNCSLTAFCKEEALIETSELERMLEDRMLSRANIKLLKIRQQRENTATTSHHSNFYFIIAISVMSIIYYVLILFYV